MRVSASDFEMGNGFLRHKPTGSMFRFYSHESIFETVCWATPESDARVSGYLKQDIWSAAQEILRHRQDRAA